MTSNISASVPFLGPTPTSSPFTSVYLTTYPQANLTSSLTAPISVSTAYSSSYITSSDSDRLIQMGFAAIGINDIGPTTDVWIGDTGAYVNRFTNGSGEDLILVIWGPGASWVNVYQPLVTISLSVGISIVISFASGAIGAWSAIYSDTVISKGLISNTWGEYTMSPAGVVDISRELNMAGHAMQIIGPECTCDMNTCVFICRSGQVVCETDYALLNCAIGSQPGAQYGLDSEGEPSGGCGGIGDNALLKTTFF